MKLYKFLSTIKHQFLTSAFGYSSVCRQQPSCSQYTAERIKKDGTIVGLAKGFWRTIHCRHF
jgi:putative component of membrane protein insertase Oxa1/YidC/SpoIIIJ protein YidD